MVEEEAEGWDDEDGELELELELDAAVEDELISGSSEEEV